MTVTFWFLLALIVYVYIGYPALLLFIALFAKSKPIAKTEFFPKVSLIIAAYNEEKNIKERIENILALDYPRGSLEVIIASDASSDRTDEFILQYKDKGIILNRRPARQGKMSAVNESVKSSSGEILVLSDADIFFKEDDIKKLVRNFSDPTIGCVIGIKKIVVDGESHTAAEGFYWRYELFLKKLEGLTGSVAGGASGCNFAVRKNLYVPLEEKTTGEDLALPLICISRGFRAIFEPEALSYEKLLPDFKAEFKRKIRIVMGGLHAISLVKPKFHLIDKFTLFKLFSHKILRWYVPFLLIGLFTVNCFLTKYAYSIFLYCQIAFYSLATLGVICLALKIKCSCGLIKLINIPAYFVLMNFAAFCAVIKYSLKMHQGWTAYEKQTQKTSR